jgi:ABC-2 type transport system ATP-binding protein
MRLFAGQTAVHVLSARPPEAGFEPITPDLEDFYFATIRGFVEEPAVAVN